MKTNPNDLKYEHVEILKHTMCRAVGQRYCGDSKEMQRLCELGLMESIGRVSWVPSEYFTITKKGKDLLVELNKESE